MIPSLCRLILFKWWKWKTEITLPVQKKCILAIAPHTSNMDFIIGILYSRAVGLKANFLMKKEWFFWPLGILMRRLGGIPVYRNKKMSLTDQLAEYARKCETFQLAITPEGTRSRVEEWKKGFYYIAYKAEIPIMLFGLDFKNKQIVCTKEVHPNGDYDAQIIEIKNYFRHFEGRHPEKFSVGTI